MSTGFMTLTFLVLLFLELAIVVGIGEPEFVRSSYTSEYKSTRVLLGNKAVTKLKTNADTRYQKWFVDTGFVNAIYYWKRMDEKKGRNEHGLEDLDKWPLEMYKPRAEVLLITLKGALFRWEQFVSIFKYFIPLVLVALIDGLNCRENKIAEFGYANPTIFHFSKNILIFLVFVPFLIAITPIGINPLLYGLVGLLFPFFLWLGASNGQHFAR